MNVCVCVCVCVFDLVKQKGNGIPYSEHLWTCLNDI